MSPDAPVLTPRARAWQQGGTHVEVAGRSIFVRDQAGSGIPIVLFHGYPSSSYDWRELIERLPGRRVLCFDFLGFGLSDKPRDQVYSLHAQASLAESLVQRLVGGPVLLVAHDMGTSVATEVLARDLEGRLGLKLAAVLLFNGSMILELASLTVAQKLLRGPLGPLVARLSNERAFRLQFRRIFSPRHPLGNEEAADQWSLLAHRGGHRIIDRLTYYLHERVQYARRWHGALRDWPGRLELAWGMRDPVCVPAVLEGVRELRPRAPVTRFEELGHYPQIEDPEAIARVVGTLADGL